MQSAMCSRCGKNIAVIFLTKYDGSGQAQNEGLCLKCARELHIKPIDDIMNRFGISEDDIDNLSGEAMNFMNGLNAMNGDGTPDSPDDADGASDEEGKTATMPFFGRIFGAKQPPKDASSAVGGSGAKAAQPNGGKADGAKKAPSHKYLDS